MSGHDRGRWGEQWSGRSETAGLMFGGRSADGIVGPGNDKDSVCFTLPNC